MTDKLRAIFRTAAVFMTLVVAANSFTPARAATCPGADTVKKAADAFIAASRSGTSSAFASVLARYADIEAVALVALGKYRAKLPAERRSEYVRNAGYYMSRFLADNAGRFSGPSQLTIASCNGNLIKTSISNQSTIVWRVSGGLIQDVQVSGIWLALQLRQEFAGIIRRNHGYVSGLLDYLAEQAPGEARAKNN